MANINCIDVSVFQGEINYRKVKSSGVTTVIIRAGYGRSADQKDRMFETNYKNARAAGLNIGAYWYSYADSVEDAKREAEACLKCIKGKEFQLPIYYDMEDETQIKYGKATLTNMARAFCDKINNSGYRSGVYANFNWFSNYLDYESLRKNYSIWLAQYNKINQLECDIWQNSSTGRVNGIIVDVDTDVILNPSVIQTNSIPPKLMYVGTFYSKEKGTFTSKTFTSNPYPSGNCGGKDLQLKGLKFRSDKGSVEYRIKTRTNPTWSKTYKNWEHAYDGSDILEIQGYYKTDTSKNSKLYEFSMRVSNKDSDKWQPWAEDNLGTNKSIGDGVNQIGRFQAFLREYKSSGKK